MNDEDAAQYHQGTFGVGYFLSKPTDVYLVGVYQHAFGRGLDRQTRGRRDQPGEAVHEQ
jgi:predicted porin